MKPPRSNMSQTLGTFPFGAAVHRIEQLDRTPRTVFVLGVYSSAVHARWLDERGRTAVNALAVASEPCIFWPGEDGMAEIIARIPVPPEAGCLEPAAPMYNGPS